MRLNKGIFTEAHAKEISTWVYEGKYSIYNFPPWKIMLKEKFALCNPIKRKSFIAYTDEADNLIGFVNLVDEGKYVFFGIGLKPNICGKGIGKEVVNMSIEESKNKFGLKPIILEVRSFNKRAIKCYESQGFKIIGISEHDTFVGSGDFYIMEYNH